MGDLVHAGLARWTVDQAGTVTKRSVNERSLAIGYTQAQLAAIDIMTDDGVPLERAATLALACDRTGDEPEAWARHFVKLRKAFRGDRGQS